MKKNPYTLMTPSHYVATRYSKQAQTRYALIGTTPIPVKRELHIDPIEVEKVLKERDEILAMLVWSKISS